MVLMQSDLPHILYNFDNGKKKSNSKITSGNKSRFVQDSLSEKLQAEAVEKMRLRHKAKKNDANEGVSLEDLFNGDADNAPIINKNNG